MIKYPIDPDFCLILNAFSQSSTLRGAAKLLETDPASLVRKIQKLSHNQMYLQKVGNRWALTEAGLRVAQWTAEMLISQSKLKDERPRLRIAAFSWLVEEMLIPELKELNYFVKEDFIWSFKMVGSDLEQELMQSRSDFVITGHAPNDPAVAHKKISRYSWIIVIPREWKKMFAQKSHEGTLDLLNSKPFIRLTNSSVDQILGFTPQIEAKVVVDGVIGLRAAVLNNLGWSALPLMSVQSLLKEKKLYSLDLPTQIEDQVSVWWLRAREETGYIAKNLAKWIAKFSIDEGRI